MPSGILTQQRSPTVFYARDYGAVFDGSTDDTAAIAATIAAAQNSGAAKGVVKLPPGSAVVSSPLNVTKSGIIVEGSGRYVTTLVSTATFGTNGTSRGVIQFTSGPSAFLGCEVRDLGFDLTASTETTINEMAGIYQDSVPLVRCAFRRLAFEHTTYTDGIYCNGLAKGTGSSGLAFEDIYGHNGGFDIGVFANGAQSNALARSITIRNIHALTDTAVNDDRIILSAHYGGAGNSELRDVLVDGVFVNQLAGTSGTVNGVKLDTGTNGYLHRVTVKNVYFTGRSGIGGNAPVYCQAESNGALVDIEVDGIHGDTCGRLHLLCSRGNQTVQAPFFTVRNVSLRGCVDTIGIELFCASVTTNDELVTIEKAALHFSTAVSGNTPVGIMLTGAGGGTQGWAGVNTIRDITLDNASVGITNNVLENGTTGASAWTNIDISRVRTKTVTTFLNFASGTAVRVHDCPGYNPVGGAVSQPAVPATTVAQTNTTGVDCMVYVAGGTVSAIAVGGTATGLTSGGFLVPAGGTITLTYSVAPTWQWIGQ